MFILRVHSVDTDHPLATEYGGFCSSSPSTSPLNPNFTERRGIVHLFRTLSHAPLSSPSSRSTTLFVVAVPNYFSSDELIRFFGPQIDNVSEVLVIRNDGMEDRYSAVIKFFNKTSADGFYCIFNGKKFSPAEAEVCHLLFMDNVDFTESADTASTPPAGFTELPTCPVCLERLDPDTSGILSTQCDHSFHCSCGHKWTYLSCQVCRLCQQQDEIPTCFICGTLENLWVCLICGFVGCGRYKDKHAISHWKNTQHCYSLDLRTQQIWDYVGDTYVHRLNQSKADGKLLEVNSRCESLEGDCGSCGYSEDSGIGEALFSSKVEAISDEYNRLLATQLKTQRHYESLILEVEIRREHSIPEAEEKAVTSNMLDIQRKLEICGEEKNAVAKINRTLIQNQDIMRKQVNEIEQRITLSEKAKDEKILDLEEQIRDLKVYIEAQKTLDKMTDENGVRGGTILPVPLEHPSPPSNRKHLKSNRRRK